MILSVLFGFIVLLSFVFCNLVYILFDAVASPNRLNIGDPHWDLEEGKWVETTEAYGEEEAEAVSPLSHHGQREVTGE